MAAAGSTSSWPSLPWRRPPWSREEVKLGAWWTGARLQSGSARRRKWLLQGKGYYATTRDVDYFGQTFYVLAEERAGITRGKEVFFVADGAGWLADLPADWI